MTEKKCEDEVQLGINIHVCDLAEGHKGAHISNDEVINDDKTFVVKVAWQEKK